MHERKLPECFGAYEEGKSRRYGLLFSVNGGAFAVATLFADRAHLAVLGGLSLWHLSVGMIVFTIAMTVDIYFFGQHLRSTLPEDAYRKDGATVAVFGTVGKCVLIIIGLLICAGWLLAALGAVSLAT